MERRFDEAGMSLGRDSLVWHTENSFYIAFNLYENGKFYPGLAEISIDNDLLWMETLDMEGWNISGGIDANGNYVYVGFTSASDNKLTKVLSLSTNSAPVADAGNDQVVIQGDTVTLDGSSSYDADLDSLTYNWSIVFRPGDSLAEITDPTSSITSFTADRPGQYVISLVVNDSFIDSDPDNITIMAVSYQDAAAEELTETINIINDDAFLPDDVFKNPKNRNALTNKIKAALGKIDEGLYEEALNKLTRDILAKTDGCAEIGFPDKNDWIRDCDSQNKVYPFIIEVITLLENLI